MKTPAEVVKENFWIGAKGGLLDLKHYLRMRESVWLFLYLLRNQTALNQAGEGVVNYGHPLTVSAIAADLKGIPERNIERWLYRLRREGYIRTEYHSKQGITFWIAKGKAKTRKVKITHDEAIAMRDGASALLAARQQAQISPPQMAGNVSDSPPDMAGYPPISPPHLTQESERVHGNASLAPPIPKGFTPENLLYHKQAAGAQYAPLSSLSLEEVLGKMQREKQPPPPMSQAELDERRRKLLQQAKDIMREHPPKVQPGKVLEMPREATA